MFDTLLKDSTRIQALRLVGSRNSLQSNTDEQHILGTDPAEHPIPDTMATTEIADRASEIENFRGSQPAGKLNFDTLGGETNSNSTATAQQQQPTRAAGQQQGDDADADDDKHTPARPKAGLTDIQKHLRQANTAKKKAIRDKRRSCDVHMMAISEDDDRTDNRRQQGDRPAVGDGDRPGYDDDDSDDDDSYRPAGNSGDRPRRNYTDRQQGDRPAVGDGDGPGHDDDDSDDDDGYRPAGKSGDRPRRNYTDSDDDDDGSEISFQGEPDMNDIINSLTDTNKQRDIVTGAKDAVLDLIDLNKLAAEWRKVEKNYSNSLEQAATFMRAGSTTSDHKPFPNRVEPSHWSITLAIKAASQSMHTETSTTVLSACNMSRPIVLRAFLTFQERCGNITDRELSFFRSLIRHSEHHFH